MESADSAPWATDHPVLEVLRSRRQLAQAGAPFHDNLRIGLAIEGGSMRGVVSAAMLCALEDSGYAPCFDDIFAFSAGALNAVYFLSGNSWYTLSIYYDDLATSRFINFGRALRGHPVVNLDYAFHQVMKYHKPPDLASVLGSPTRLHIAITDVDNLASVEVTDFQEEKLLLDSLYASSWIPIVPFKTTVWQGNRALDGGVLMGHPLRMAASSGCTHVLSLSTRPMRSGWNGRHSLSQRIGFLHLEQIRYGLGKGYLKGVRDYWADLKMAKEHRTAPKPRPYLLDLAPLHWTPEIKNHEISPMRLLNAARHAYGVMHCALAGITHTSLADQRLQIVPRLTAVGSVFTEPESPN